MIDNEDVNDISKAAKHLEISLAAKIFMEILKFETPRVIVHIFFIHTLQNDSGHFQYVNFRENFGSRGEISRRSGALLLSLTS